ncbi:MAG: hypothetical protein KKB50_02795 [Planctomycetes bacterium]|nr:hypothetical protein [Planctomycetota bacterium]
MLDVLVEHWQRWHRGPRRLRWPAKWGGFLLVLGLVLYPKVWLLPTWLRRMADLNAVVDPTHPGLAELERDVHGLLGGDESPEALLEAVQQVVYRHIPYAWDWDVWGVMDYLPTVDEVLAQGREDCDGRAVLAASLLRRLGQPAWLVCDLKHTWVGTPVGETMSPGAGEQTLVGDQEGTRPRISLGLLANVGRSLAFGASVFPLARELIILATLCAVSVQPWSSMWRRGAGCLLLLVALGVLRTTGGAAGEGTGPHGAWIWAGAGLAVGGWLLLMVRAGGPRKRSRPTLPESQRGDEARHG